jgi:hypothetical protein
MTEKVTSLGELFQTVPQPQPQPQPPIQVVEEPVQPVQLTTSPSQKEAQRKRFTNDQHQAMQAFYMVYPHQTKINDKNWVS